LSAKGEYAEAELLFGRALAIEEHVLGPDHPDLGKTLKGLADLYAKTGRVDEAEQLRARMKAIREKHENGRPPPPRC
jgi:pentatricopeptide repeat protein